VSTFILPPSLHAAGSIIDLSSLCSGKIALTAIIPYNFRLLLVNHRRQEEFGTDPVDEAALRSDPPLNGRYFAINPTQTSVQSLRGSTDQRQQGAEADEQEKATYVISSRPHSSVLSQITIYNRAWPLYTEACSGRRPRWP
jgi:hypothetical protein